ncbi:hypothetical protein PRIPAC_96817 [Pristionchus pacificus]|uniref:Uncharacterized protein n=1 Tax=Pristionchus pacificus TaxID=54126 RepID=A0A454XQL5_PRIPA|nr:hypothetical protein PRIPAC_96817 [Pristionchus pacificus]|eukprot:PDM65779.1 hypothetical protein PRIPAC_45180 [Pristionchus pacificus]
MVPFSSLGDLANRKNQTTNEKLSLVLKSTHELKIVNGNANANAGPLVLYIVEGSHDGRVFEADGLDFAITEPMFMTVMSARTFTLIQDDDEAALGPVRVTLTGFDGMHDLDCPGIYKKE